MEKLQANMKTVNAALSKPRGERWNEKVIQHLAAAALHFRQEMADADYEIYLDGLKHFEAGRIRQSLETCLRECEFMPKLKEILERMPDRRTSNKAPDLKVVREWEEPYGNQIAHFTEYEGGYRQMRFVAKSAPVDAAENLSTADTSKSAAKT